MLVLHTHKKRDLVHVGLQRNGCETVIRGSRMACQVTSGRIIHILRIEHPFIHGNSAEFAQSGGESPKSTYYIITKSSCIPS